jgi:hypothetical protein
VVKNLFDSEQLILDGEIVVQTKSGIRFGSALTAPIPETDGLYIYVIIGAFNGLTASAKCIVGKPLELDYEKSTKTYSAEYNGHKIECINKAKASMLIDGAEVDKQKSVFDSFVSLGTKMNDSDKRYIAVFDGLTNGLKVKCALYAEAENIRMIPCEKQGGELIPVYGDGTGDAFMLGMIIGSGM